MTQQRSEKTHPKYGIFSMKSDPISSTTEWLEGEIIIIIINNNKRTTIIWNTWTLFHS